MRLCYALGYYVIGPLIKWWVRGVELHAQAADILAGRGEVAEHPDVIDEHAVSACALTVDHFDLWEKELSKHGS